VEELAQLEARSLRALRAGDERLSRSIVEGWAYQRVRGYECLRSNILLVE